ncbi:MAG: FG-GAP repeat domain-containing protein [Actinomycetota bacterium]
MTWVLAGSLAVSTVGCQRSSAGSPLVSAPAAIQQTVRLGPSTSYPTGPELQAVAIADLNGDGVLDLASANYGAKTISVLLGAGDGTFEPKVDQPAGIPHPQAIASSDLNGDGSVDLVLVNGSRADGVAVLINHADATFTSRVYAGGHDAQTVIATDLNGDGVPDIVTANGVGGVTVLLGRGDGSLAKPVDISTDSALCSGVTAADVNGDGTIDLITANSLLGHGASDQSVSVLLGNGDGTFQPATVYDSVGTQPTMIVTADLNADGKLDLVTPNGAPSTDVSVLLGRGDGTFRTPTRVEVGNNPHSVVAVDVSGDGIPDLVTGDLGTSFDYHYPENQGLTVRLGVGDGTFGPKIPIENAFPTSLEAADLNGDGRIDLIVPNELNNSVAILLNRTSN